MHIGVFKDVLNLVFQDKSTGKVSSDNIATTTVDTRTKRREEIISKCLQFLKFLSR